MSDGKVDWEKRARELFGVPSGVKDIELGLTRSALCLALQLGREMAAEAYRNAQVDTGCAVADAFSDGLKKGADARAEEIVGQIEELYVKGQPPELVQSVAAQLARATIKKPETSWQAGIAFDKSLGLAHPGSSAAETLRTTAIELGELRELLEQIKGVVRGEADPHNKQCYIRRMLEEHFGGLV